MNNTLFMKVGVTLLVLSFIFTAGQLVAPYDSAGQGDLMIMPRRVILDANKRTQELTVANTGSDSTKYLISVIHYRMLENGAFEQIAQPDSAQHFADKNFRFFPRTVTLAPNESQTIKIQAINTNEMQPGEYRSHLYFRAVTKNLPAEKEAFKPPKSMSVQLVPTFGIAIPVIIRSGALTLSVKLEKPMFSISTAGIPQLSMLFKRTGNISVYGDIKIEHVSVTGRATQVGIAKGFAIYTPNSVRNFTLNLDKNSTVDYRKGKLNIIYTTLSETKPIVITSSQVDLL
ncbi:fimbria/pilus periplasmic chaperone [Flavobacterium sp. AC]|uniref:Fimbria/pilus periplasmic chaperone n=1 Tax=Flavobacterium azizsancarii TaxID=2961580 RepID=A0ABT4WF55_9FLAO|nr:fimbria/pilus periplasmic chaperone [Flavobacterium azizsancarii]MDA6070862.1 fimbria/pilus periplasmic chaperone [Flavobacterium azizsancarii]